MTEEIIIDGVNVAGCGYYEPTLENRYKPECNCKETKIELGYYQNEYSTSECEGNDCLYKQLKRLEQENKELKAYKDVNEDFKKAWDELNEKYKRYRSALEEIREIANDTFHCCDDDCGNARTIKLVIDKINEVLNDT